ncbi:hypothetical protein GOP47_0003319, partial [Adiantum capillus-veneris]
LHQHSWLWNANPTKSHVSMFKLAIFSIFITMLLCMLARRVMISEEILLSSMEHFFFLFPTLIPRYLSPPWKVFEALGVRLGIVNAFCKFYVMLMMHKLSMFTASPRSQGTQRLYCTKSLLVGESIIQMPIGGGTGST